MGSVMNVRQPEVRQRSHAYELFILVLTVLSLVVMVAMLLPLDDSTINILQFYDNLICLVFLVDFVIRMRAPTRTPTTSSRSGVGSTYSARSRRSALPSGTRLYSVWRGSAA